MINYMKFKDSNQVVFFDRGIPGLLGYAEMIGLNDTILVKRAITEYRYNSTVFMFPPCNQICQNDMERFSSCVDFILQSL